jgi:hypothetical protein
MKRESRSGLCPAFDSHWKFETLEKKTKMTDEKLTNEWLRLTDQEKNASQKL